MRYSLAESPLTALARRRDKDGSPFLSDKLVTAGERLREDFELAQMGPNVTQNWSRFLTSAGRGTYVPDSGVNDAPADARVVTRASIRLAQLARQPRDLGRLHAVPLGGVEEL